VSIRLRRRIIKKLAHSFSLEECEIESTVYNFNYIPTYSTRIIKNRKVIDKSKLLANENIALEYYKGLINSYSTFSFPNRSFIMTELMNIIPYLHCYNSYTIYKFDFKEFFYNIDLKNCFKFINEDLSLKKREFKFLKNYLNNLKECTPGIGLHNSLVELIGTRFDLKVMNNFKDMGLLTYCRYVDDCILILDEKLDETIIVKEIKKLMKEVFGQKLSINESKTDYYNCDDTNYKFTYLGYVFEKGQSKKAPYKLGIAPKKLIKYVTKINEIVIEYKHDQDIEALSLKLELMFKRVVFYGSRKPNERKKWQVRGIGDSYKELKRFINDNDNLKNLTKETADLFEWTIRECFRNNGIHTPPKINNQLKNKKFASCFINNRATLLHRKIGLNHKQLKKVVSILDSRNLDSYGYKELANILLNKVTN
jgi:hypothetical protein